MSHIVSAAVVDDSCEERLQGLITTTEYVGQSADRRHKTAATWLYAVTRTPSELWPASLVCVTIQRIERNAAMLRRH